MSASTRTVLAAYIAPVLCCLAFVPLIAGAATTGSGKSTSQTRSVAEFQAISLAGAMNLKVRQGDSPSLQVEADDNLLPLLESRVVRVAEVPTLELRWKPGESVRPRAPVRVTVVLPRLTAVDLSGAGDVELGPFSTPALRLSLSGSGDARLNGLGTDDLAVRISGSGDVDGSGHATRVRVSIAGSGNVRLAELRGDDVTVTIAGSGDAAVNAQKTLDVSIAGSGDVVYTGAATLKSSVAGSGSISRR